MDKDRPCECDVCKVRGFERNHFFPGKQLTARDLTDEQTYFNEKRWLINRMVLGWGIVCGLDVSLDDGGALVVRPGLALDCCGHELLVCDKRRLCVEEFVDAVGGAAPRASDSSGTPKPSEQTGQDAYKPPPEYKPHEHPRRWVLCLEYRQCSVEPCRPAPGSCGQYGPGQEFSRVRDDYRLVIRPWKKACPSDQSEPCCPFEGLGRRTPLYEALVEASHKCHECRHCDCVVLATGTIDHTTDPPQIQLEKDDWKYRRIVFTNPMLADVIRCLHDGLPHITDVSWKPGTDFKADEFIDLISKQHLKVTFDQLMKDRTVTNPRTCRLSIFHPQEGSCLTQLIIPVHRIAYDASTRTATYYFDEDCIEQELRKVCRRVRKPAEVELVLHGCLIHNEHGRALDAELIDEFPTGNGVEGGEFIAYYTVVP